MTGRALAGVALAALACHGPPPAAPPYEHNRDDYRAFRDAHPGLLEPNYLPFMVYDVPVRPVSWWSRLGIRLGLAEPPERRLVFCHWEAADLPIRVWIEPPTGLETIEEDTPAPRVSPARYVRVVEEVLAEWQNDLDEVVRFAPAEGPRDADLHVRLLSERAPETDEDVRVYGAAAVGDSCSVLGGDPAERLDVRFKVRDVRLYVADAYGLLLPEQVKGIARHEIGHALGMRGHSPIPADLMYEEADDRRDRAGLGLPDMNSFVSLYALPSGTVYADPARVARAPGSLRPDGPPALDLAPHVDIRLGFEVQLPEGWQRQPTPYGVVAVNGVPWDYDASFQLNVFRFDTLEDFVDRYGLAYLRGGTLLAVEDVEVAGRRARTAAVLTDAGTRETFTLIESGDGRVLLAIAECAAPEARFYRALFAAVLDSLDLAGDADDDRGRVYRAEGKR